ncbi:MAG TPA: hypothetical protein PKZ59_05680 [Candidatus Hydrogenedentes bacterium]|jgi:hypothetical protein|nr:hypothetical protein [Candidatus Hydrogenedentota bacterium]
MMTFVRCSLALLLFALLFGLAAEAEGPDRTCFQEAGHWQPAIDLGADMAIVYGVNDSFADRVRQWREKGYSIGMMTGIAWGGYDDYYRTADGFKKDEVQTRKSGKLYMHGDSTTVGYNVPTDAYIDYIKQVVNPAVDLGAQAIFLEEPEYWAEAGWSEAFKEEWLRFYGEPWQEPDSSPDAQYRASKLKYELYFKALREVFRHIKERAAAQGREVECHVPTHSLNSYAQWRIVSPMSHLMDLEEMDGYIAQVWTGTARTLNLYRGVQKERTFESGFLEYSQMVAMVRPTGRKLWFLADPIEDNPNYSWRNYKENYECTVISSLLWPENYRYEIMPWPTRIFKGSYPKVDLDTKSDDREGIPADYAAELMAVTNALNHMDQDKVQYDTGTQGIGVLVSDTLMFQRAAPRGSDALLSNLYGIAMPLVKHGIPARFVQMETLTQPGALDGIHLLLMTYDGQKPLKPDYHEVLDQWVRGGGALLFVDDGSDPYNRVREWWNDEGKNDALPQDDLFRRLGISSEQADTPVAVDGGRVYVMNISPTRLAKQTEGAERLMQAVALMLQQKGITLQTRNYMKLRRGPFLIASVMDESISEQPLSLQGSFIDLLDAALPVVKEKTLEPGQRCLLFDLDWAAAHHATAEVAAASCRVREESMNGSTFSFVTRGPENVRARMRIRLPKAPETITVAPDDTEFLSAWDSSSGTLMLECDNQAKDIRFSLQLQ